MGYLEAIYQGGANKLKRLWERDLEGYEFVVPIIGGKTIGTDEMVIAL